MNIPLFLKINGKLYINSSVVSLIIISSLISGRCIENIGIISRSSSIFYFEESCIIIYYILHTESEIDSFFIALMYDYNLQEFLRDILKSYYREYLLTKNNF